jgi:alkylhydroperoxidase family enzyme
MQKSDIETLHRHGFDDDQITVATQVIGYFNYINRIADGLGVDPDDWMTLSRDEWLQRKARNYE